MSYLKAIMEAPWFDACWVFLTMHCVTFVTYFIIINEQAKGYNYITPTFLPMGFMVSTYGFQF